MYTIQLEDEAVDSIVRSVLKEDYKGLCRDIESIQSKESLDRIDKEDLNFNVRIVKAMETVFEYYFSEHDLKQILRKWHEMSNEIKVIDDFLEKEIFDKIYNFITSRSFPWYINNGLVYENDGGFMINHCFHKHNQSSEYIGLLEPIINKLNANFLTRAQINLVPKENVIKESGFHYDAQKANGEPRSDRTVAILYFNTNDGYTYFENGFKVKSVANRIAIFNNTIKHGGTNCTDENYRLVLNMVYES